MVGVTASAACFALLIKGLHTGLLEQRALSPTFSPREWKRELCLGFNMKNTSHAQAVVGGVPVQSIRYAAEMCGKSAVVTELNRLRLQSASSYESSHYKQGNAIHLSHVKLLCHSRCLQELTESFWNAEADAPVAWMRKFSKKADSYLKGIKDHVSLGPKISETVKGKLSLGAKILRAGGVERVFRQNFSVERGEKLLQAFQCYLSTTAGPIVGLLFISTHKIAFRSDRSIRVTSPRGNLVRVPYKVLTSS
ncbi:hypothetical protein BHE74_00000773 [Ensete ventricosum]|nr:hypothetical protein BHE74_00000773 [Ensete ventricosum]RZR98094.1 hypothetical protein BHM03_00027400 [Ensete ventricosum]